MEKERDAAREKAWEIFRARCDRDCVRISGLTAEEMFFRGHDAALAADWVAVESDADNPKLGGFYIVTIDWGDLGNDDPYGYVAYFDRDSGEWRHTETEEMSWTVKVVAYLPNFPLKYQPEAVNA